MVLMSSCYALLSNTNYKYEIMLPQNKLHILSSFWEFTNVILLPVCLIQSPGSSANTIVIQMWCSLTCHSVMHYIWNSYQCNEFIIASHLCQTYFQNIALILSKRSRYHASIIKASHTSCLFVGFCNMPHCAILALCDIDMDSFTVYVHSIWSAVGSECTRGLPAAFLLATLAHNALLLVRNTTDQ